MPSKYVVVFKDSVSDAEINKAKDDLTAQGGQIENEYNMPGFRGFAAVIPDQYLTSFQSLQADKIESIEPDGVVTTQ